MANSQALTVDPTAYARLLKVIEAEILSGRKIIQQTQAKTYWKIGKLISEHLLENKDRARYGKYLFPRLSKSLDIAEPTLHQAVKFHQEYPILNARSELPWTHYRTLLGLPDSSARQAFVRKSLRKNLTTRQLQKEVTRYKVDHKIVTDQPVPKLAVQRGRLYTYRLAKAVTPLFKGSVFVDCGFRVWYPVRCTLKSVAKGEVVETVVTGNSFEVVKSTRTQNDLYTYLARVKRIIDADTLWAEIDLGLGGVTLQKLRLRGIDAPELSTSAGRRAKRFVEKLLAPCPFIVVKTYKDQSDKYDRYLVDLFYLAGENNAQVVASEGKFLNQELLDAGLAVRYEG